MFEIIATKRDGQLWKHTQLPFKGSSLFRFHDSDVTEYIIGYDDVEELVEFLNEKFYCDSEFPIFKIIENKILDIEFVSNCDETIEESIERYSEFENNNWFVYFNGIYSIENYIKDTKELI